LTVGQGTTLSRLADPSELRATRIGGPGAEAATGSRIQLKWRWAPEASATRIVARQGLPPIGPDDPAAVVVNVTRNEYDHVGSWTVSLPRVSLPESSDLEIQRAIAQPDLPLSDRWHVSVYSMAEIDGVSLFSPGLEPTATIAVPGPHPEVTISYLLKRAWFPGRPWSLILRTEPPDAAVPPMVLIANARAIPLSTDDGEIIARFPPAHGGATHTIRTPVNLARCGVRAFPDPTMEPGSVPPIRIRHPETGPTRV
jgi:hypothetical protein